MAQQPRGGCAGPKDLAGTIDEQDGIGESFEQRDFERHRVNRGLARRRQGLRRDHGQREDDRGADEDGRARDGQRPRFDERATNQKPGADGQQQRGGYDDESAAVRAQEGVGGEDEAGG